MTKSSRWSFDEKEMTSIISGHGINEAVGRWFVGQSINTSSQFNDYVQTVFGNQTSPKLVRLFARLQDLYPAVEAPNYPFKTTNERVARYTADIGVNCHYRALTNILNLNIYLSNILLGRNTVHGSISSLFLTQTDQRYFDINNWRFRFFTSFPPLSRFTNCDG